MMLVRFEHHTVDVGESQVEFILCHEVERPAFGQDIAKCPVDRFDLAFLIRRQGVAVEDMGTTLLSSGNAFNRLRIGEFRSAVAQKNTEEQGVDLGGKAVIESVDRICDIDGALPIQEDGVKEMKLGDDESQDAFLVRQFTHHGIHLNRQDSPVGQDKVEVILEQTALETGGITCLIGFSHLALLHLDLVSEMVGSGLENPVSDMPVKATDTAGEIWVDRLDVIWGLSFGNAVCDGELDHGQLCVGKVEACASVGQERAIFLVGQFGVIIVEVRKTATTAFAPITDEGET